MGLVALVGCAPGGQDGPGRAAAPAAFQGTYLSARADLEGGRYDAAVRGYARLTRSDGTATPRMLLELSHAQLRSGNFADAADTARQVAQGSESTWRMAALAVLGTAEHEMARSRTKAGQWDDATRAHMLRAAAALDEMLRDGAAMDSAGTMKKRRAAIAEDMQVMGGLAGNG